MNFDHINQVSDYVREKIMPYLSNKTERQITDFGAYIERVSESPSCKWMRTNIRIFPINYYVDPEVFAKKHEKQCISFAGVSNPQEGAITVVYQLSPTLHVLARLFHWVENDIVRAYFALVCVYRDQDEYLKFFDETKRFRLKGNTEEKSLGFQGFASPPSDDLGELVRRLEVQDEGPDDKTA